VFTLADTPLIEVILCTMVQLWRAVQTHRPVPVPKKTLKKGSGKAAPVAARQEDEEEDEVHQAHTYLLRSLANGGLARLVARFHGPTDVSGMLLVFFLFV
jgi:hypothetical protein